MNNGADAADQMVRDGIEIVECGVKLSALGAKNVAAIAAALIKENPKLKGKTKVDRLLREGKELKVFALKGDDLREFNRLAKQYGVLYTAIKEKGSKGEVLSIMAKAEDVSKLNRVFELMGYELPKEQVVTRKKTEARSPSEKSSMKQRDGLTKANQTLTTDKPSVKRAVDALRAKALAELKRKAEEREKQAVKERE